MTDDLSAAIARLDDYVRGEGEEADADAYEDTLFARALAGEAPELVAYDSLVASLHHLGARGTFMTFVTAAEADRLRARYGRQAAFVSMTAEPAQRVRVAASAEIVITRIPLDLHGVERLDIELGVDGSDAFKTMPDVAFAVKDGAVYFCCERALAHEVVGLPLIGRFWAARPEGCRLIAERRSLSELEN